MTQPTSVQTYHDLLSSGELGKRQRDVLTMLIDFGPMTGSEINQTLGTPSGHKRLSELKAMGVVREGKARPCKVTGREAIEWEITGQAPVRPTPTVRPSGESEARLLEAARRWVEAHDQPFEQNALESMLDAAWAAFGRGERPKPWQDDEPFF